MKFSLFLNLAAIILWLGACGAGLANPELPNSPTPEETAASEPNSLVVTPSPAENPDEAVQNKPMASLDGAAIIFRRSGGIAGVDEPWKIYPDGRIEGPDNQQQQVEPAKVQALLEMIQSAGFFELDNSYLARNNCCDRFTYEITVQLEDKIKTVTAGEASPAQPEQLSKVIGAINELLIASK